MKIKIIIIALVCSLGALTSCGGDHGSTSGKDTEANQYKVSKDTSKMDTSKTTSEDYSGSGGTKVDTPKKN